VPYIKKKIIGTLVPLSALSSISLSKYDQGTFAAGIKFFKWLRKTHQSAWQLLPLHQTQLEKRSRSKRVPSPYKGYGIGLDPKYLPTKYSKLEPTVKELRTFLSEHREWVEDYAFFCALTDEFGTDDWRVWDKRLKNRDQTTLDTWRNKLNKKIQRKIIIQWQLHKAYKDFRNEAKRQNITLIGDLPFYVSINSPLVWAHQSIFLLERDRSLRHVSGIPNHKSSHHGRQIWGHPLYKWESREGHEELLRFWKLRLCYASSLFDAIRMDHAKAFFEYGEISLDDSKKDRFVKGPGIDVFLEVINYSKECGISVFAEDAGTKLEKLRKAMRSIDIPGIKILRYAYNEKFDKTIPNYAEVDTYSERSVAYTSTHDTDSLVKYVNKLTIGQKKKLAASLGLIYQRNAKDFVVSMRELLINSPSQLVIIPIQDWLLTTERINTPGTEKEVGDRNWKFKLKIPIEKLPLVN
jgi:4-alpha-glucanotransferase